MKKLFMTFAVLAALLCSCTHSQAPSADPAAIPHLEKRGPATQLIVDGKPWMILGCELTNSAASSVEYMSSRWAALKESGVNTVLATVSWEQVEPAEGEFDFSVVDGIITDARKSGLKLVLLWMATWKNGISSYQPMWVKKDAERFPLALTKEGGRLPILSAFGEQTCAADAKAFAALMGHLREFDGRDHTVIMVQLENEVGLHGHTRDYGPLAEAAFRSPVPQSLSSSGGNWEEAFGKGNRTDEMFMAWHYASYIGKVAAAGKAEYPLPMFVNAWIVQPEDRHPGNYPSGGPQAQNHAIYRIAAPDIDILSPDIYLPDFPDVLEMYCTEGNPIFVPESNAGQRGAANAAYLFGEKLGFGYSPFGFDRNAMGGDNETFRELYACLASCQDEVLAAQADGRIRAAWVSGEDSQSVVRNLVMDDVTVRVELVSSGWRNGGAPQLTGGAYDPKAIGYAIVIRQEEGFLVLGSNCRVTFAPSDGQGTLGLAKVTEGSFEKGKWHEGRWLNGDEIQLSYALLASVAEGQSGQGLNFGTPHPGFIKVQLYKY